MNRDRKPQRRWTDHAIVSHRLAHQNETYQESSPSVDDDLSLWIPPKAKDRQGLEAEEERPHAKEETRQKIGAVLQSMDLIVDDNGFLLPRKAKCSKEERTVDNELYADEGSDGSSSEDCSSEDSSSQELVIARRTNQDSMSSMLYCPLVQDDGDLKHHPKTPSKPSRQGMASFSTLDTEAVTRTPSASHSRRSFMVSSITSFQSPPHREIPTSFGFVDDLISPLPDDPASSGSCNTPSSPGKGSRRGSSSISSQRRLPYSSPVVSQTRIARAPRKMGNMPFHSPQGLARHGRPSVRRSQSESLTEMYQSPNLRARLQRVGLQRGHSDDPTKKYEPFASPNMGELLQCTSTINLSQTATTAKPAAPARRKTENDTSGRSRGTMSTEGATLTYSTGRESSLSNSDTSKSAGDQRRRSSLLEEHLEFYSPSKSVFSTRRRVSRVDADGFPIWALDDDQGFPMWGMDEDPGTGARGGGTLTDSSSSQCSDAGAVIVPTRKVLVVKKTKGPNIHNEK
jgi:hypothetical protein